MLIYDMRFLLFFCVSLSVFNAKALPGENDDQSKSQFLRHIGIPDCHDYQAEGTKVAILESGYDPEFPYSGTVVYVSPSVNPEGETYDELASPKFTDNEMQELYERANKQHISLPAISSGIMGSPLLLTNTADEKSIVETGMESKALTAPPSAVIIMTDPKSITTTLSQLSIKRADHFKEWHKDIADGDGISFKDEDTAITTTIRDGKVLSTRTVSLGMSIRRDDSSPDGCASTMNVTLSNHVDPEAIRKHMEKTALSRRNSAEHGRKVIETFFQVAPKSHVALYSPIDMAEVALDNTVKVVNFSGAISSPATGQTFAECLKVFKDSGKLLVLGLANDDFPCLEKKKVLELLQLAKSSHDLGFEMIVCSAASVVDDELLGNVGDYIEEQDTDFHDYYMTAPGFAVPLFGEELEFGCSFSAPCVSAAAAILLSDSPDLTAYDLRRILVESGRKSTHRSEEMSQAPDSNKKMQFLSEAARAGFEIDESLQINERYASAVRNLYNRMDDSDVFEKVMASDLLRWHVLTLKDAKKYKNHLDIQSALKLNAASSHSEL